MIDHISTYATDFASSKAFYESVLAELGYSGHIWTHKGTGPPLDVAELLARASAAKHFDVLYLPIGRRSDASEMRTHLAAGRARR